MTMLACTPSKQAYVDEVARKLDISELGISFPECSDISIDDDGKITASSAMLGGALETVEIEEDGDVYVTRGCTPSNSFCNVKNHVWSGKVNPEKLSAAQVLIRPTISNNSFNIAAKKKNNDSRASLREKQQADVRRALDPTYVYEYTPDVDGLTKDLTPPYKLYYQHLLNIQNYTAVLQLLERDLKALEYYRDIKTRGSEEMLRLFLRQFTIEGCGPYVKEDTCSPHPEFASPDPNGTAWPNDLTDDKFAKLKEILTPQLYAAVMSPYTIVENDKDSYKATSYVEYGPYKPIFLKIAGEFEAISKIEGIDEPSKKTAAAYADACRGRGKNPLRPFEEAEFVWATNQASVLTFTFGPFEEQPNLDHFGIKRGFQMDINKVRKEMSLAIEGDLPIVSNLNDYLRGRGMTVPETSKGRRVVHLSDTLYTTFKYSNGHGSSGAQTLPNDGPVVEKVGRRVDTKANLLGAIFDKVVSLIRDRVIHPSQRSHVTLKAFEKQLELHELAHSAGLMPYHKIIKDGREISLEDAQGAGVYWLVDEAKADSGAAAGISTIRDKKGNALYSKKEVTDYYVVHVAGLIRGLRYDKTVPHSWGSRSQLGYLFKVGAVEIRDGYVLVNIDKICGTISDYLYELAAVQASGVKENVVRFVKRDIEYIPAELNDWVAFPRTPTGRLNDVPMNTIMRTPDLFEGMEGRSNY